MTTLRWLLWVTLAVAGCDDTASRTQPLPIGSACTQNSACGVSPYFCDTDSAGGYCKTVCHKDADCPTNTVCVGAALSRPGACFLRCSPPLVKAECRVAEGYVCAANPPDASHSYCAPPDTTPDGG